MSGAIDILSIEDEADIRELLTITLEAEGFRVLSAATGEQGLQMARAENPALILKKNNPLHSRLTITRSPAERPPAAAAASTNAATTLAPDACAAPCGAA